MDEIQFLVDDGSVRIVINGRDLIEMLREYEMPFGVAEGHPNIAGGYSGLPAEWVLPPSNHFLGEPHRFYRGQDNETHVFRCRCGLPYCWPFSVRITVTDAEVIWDSFSQPHRTPQSQSSHWDYSGFAPFHFDIHQYTDALRNAAPE